MSKTPGMHKGYGDLIHEDKVHRLLYTDTGIFADEMTRIFASVWVYLAHESQIPENNDFITTSLGLRPVIVNRDHVGKIRVLFNRCTHRGTTLCRTQNGKARSFQCPYHGWTFSNTGKLNGVPWPDGYASELTDEQYNLAQLPRVASYRGFIFGSLNLEIESLVDYLGPITQPIDEWLDRHPGGKLVISGANRLKYMANWKLAYDNSSDGYHVIFSHRSLLAMENRLETDKDKGMSYYKDSPDQTPMFVRYTGNGHHYKDKRPMIEDRPGALWAIEASHPGKEHYEKKFRTLLGENADRALDLAASEPVNINVFPNLLILGNHIQVLQPLSVNETNTTWYGTAIVDDGGEFAGVTDDINTLRMRTQESFPNFGEVDDLTNFEHIQAGLAAEEDEWIYMHRGMDIPGRIKLEADGSITAPATDEVFMREYMKVYKKLMITESPLQIVRDPDYQP